MELTRQTQVQVDPAIVENEPTGLSEAVLNIIGKRVLDDKVTSPAIQPDVGRRWEDILNQGLPKDERTQLIKKYPIPENCTLADPPKLNPEVKATIQEIVCNRDARIAMKQTKLAAGLSASGKAMSLVLKRESTKEDIAILGCLGDIGLLTDLQHDETTIRRNLILANINPALKETLVDMQADEYLFSNKLSDVLKAAKAMETVSSELRPKGKSQHYGLPKNSKAPPRQFKKGYTMTSGGQRQHQREFQSQKRSPYYQNQRSRSKKEPQQQLRRRRR